MNETIGDRVRKLRKSLALTQKEFGDSIMLAHSSICLLEKDKLGRIDRTISNICKEYGVNKEWLLTGYGPMYMDDNSQIIAPLANEMRKVPSLLETASISAPHMNEKDWEKLNNFVKEMEG